MAKKARAKKSPKNGASKRAKGNVTLGPVVTKKVRVPINAAVYAKKESELAQLEVEVRKINRKIKPDKDQIRLHRQAIIELTKDIEENTEERDEKVREEFHWNTNEVRVLRSKDGKGLERRTMTAQERARTADIEDEDRAAPAAPTEPDEEPAATPGEAMAAAREDNGERGDAVE